ncbi:MAG: transglutaminase domain-containing protein, partial [Chthonomonadaceae bacterium]|nr:transglutaminase domain-containing protein [Chthonomonadaceae bacterium]
MKGTVELGFIDHFLVLVACTSSLFALGESLSKHVLATLLAVSSVVSILCGYVLSRYLAKVNVKAFDGYLWAGLALAAAVLAFPLNRLLPEEGFPFQLFAGTWLSFMVVFCGFVSWRDQTLLFLNLPCISVFALVGTFDTFAPATALFFVFIVCSSLLYSRIHKRSMILRAAQAGHKDVGLLDRDAWRWMAGPEWAVGSAGLIVIFSLIFGPILRFSLQPVSGTLKMSLPTTPTTMSTQGNATISDVQIGRGPITLSDQVLFRLRVIEPSVLRTATFVRYQGNGWSRNTGRPFARIFGQPVSSAGGNNKWVVAWPDGAPVEPLPKVPVAEFELLGPTSPQIVVPAPGPVIGMSSHFEFPCQFFPSGLVFSETTLNEGQSVKFRYSRPAPGSDPGPAQLPDSYEQIKESFLDIGKVPDSVIVFVNQTIRGLSNDYEKAVALQNAISNLAAYSLKPDPQDPARDAIEQFLFERKVGYCDLFATSLAVCARIAGLPSRYAVG